MTVQKSIFKGIKLNSTPIDNKVSVDPKALQKARALHEKSQSTLVHYRTKSEQHFILDKLEQLAKGKPAPLVPVQNPTVDRIVLPPHQRSLLDTYIQDCIEALLDPMRKAPLLFLSGRPGFGKSTILEAISDRLELDCVRLEGDIALDTACAADKIMVFQDPEVAVHFYRNAQGRAFVVAILDDRIVDGPIPGWYIQDTEQYRDFSITIRLNEKAYATVAPELLSSILHQRGITQLTPDQVKRVMRTILKVGEVSPYNFAYLVEKALLRYQARGSNAQVYEEFLAQGLEIAASREPLRCAAEIKEPELSLDQLIFPAMIQQEIKKFLRLSQAIQGVTPYTCLKRMRALSSSKMLLFGPPGCGKTALAEAIAKDLKKPLFVLDVSKLKSSFVGESEKNLKDVFMKAEAQEACFFIDECDALISRRDQGMSMAHERSLINLMLELIWSYKGILILATNLPGDIDPAFSSRIPYQIHIPLPTRSEAVNILKSMLEPDAPLAPDVDLNRVLEGLPLMNGRCLRNLVEDAFAIMLLADADQLTEAMLREAALKASKDHIGADKKATVSRLGFGEGRS